MVEIFLPFAQIIILIIQSTNIDSPAWVHVYYFKLAPSRFFKQVEHVFSKGLHLLAYQVWTSCWVLIKQCSEWAKQGLIEHYLYIFLGVHLFAITIIEAIGKDYGISAQTITFFIFRFSLYYLNCR